MGKTVRALACILLMIACFVSASIGSERATLISYPHPSDHRLGDYAWTYGHTGQDRWWGSERETHYFIDPGGQALTFYNPPKHRPYLISRPVDLGINGGRLRLKFQCIPNENHSPDRSSYLVIRRLRDRETMFIRRFDLAVRDTLRVDLTIPVDRSSGRIRIVIQFSSGIKSGVINHPSLRYAGPHSGELITLPIGGLTVSQQFYQANETVHLLPAAHAIDQYSYAWSIADHQDTEVLDGVWSATTGTDIGDLPLGWYRLTSKFDTGDIHYQTSTVFVVIPDSSREQNGSTSAFGVQVEMNPAGLRKMNLLGAGWVRLHGVEILKWKSVEPEPGQWLWPDSAVTLFTESGKAILANLGQTPDWASSRPDAPHYPSPTFFSGPAAHIPRDMSDWENYVRQVVSRYQQQITCWEIWNEPDIHFLVSDENGKVDNYIKLLSTAHGVIEQINPDLQMLAPGVAYLITDDEATNPDSIPADTFTRIRNPGFYSGFKASGSGDYFDIFSFHHYSTQNRNQGIPTILENSRLQQLSGEITEDYGDQRENWVTEYNVLGYGGISAPALDSLLARQVCLEHFELFARGISKVFSYTSRYYVLGFSPFDNFFEPPKDPTQVFAAYAVMTWKLDGYSYHSSNEYADGKLRHYRFVNAHNDTTYIFIALGPATKFNVPAEGTITDYLGKESKVWRNDTWMLAKNDFIYFNAACSIDR